jgi:nucleotide-binding universal stress UspA family protein
MSSTPTTPGPVLICFDGSSSAKQALEVATSTLRDRGAVLLHVWNPPDRVFADAYGLDEDERRGPSYEHLEDFAQSRAAEIAANGRELAEAQGISVTPLVERNRSTVWKTIVEISDELDSSLIVIGTHGHTALQSGLLGSVSNALLHNASRPVLVAPEVDARER